MTEEKFWESIRPEGSRGCWNWTLSADTRGYGHLSWLGKTQRAHRVALSLTGVEISGLHVLHSCDNRLCCNPDHLFVGSHADNMADMARKGRSAPKGGESNGRAILSPDDVLAIRADMRGTRSIAKDYPVSRAAVQRIKSGKAWACV